MRRATSTIMVNSALPSASGLKVSGIRFFEGVSVLRVTVGRSRLFRESNPGSLALQASTLPFGQITMWHRFRHGALERFRRSPR